MYKTCYYTESLTKTLVTVAVGIAQWSELERWWADF